MPLLENKPQVENSILEGVLFCMALVKTSAFFDLFYGKDNISYSGMIEFLPFY